MKKHDEEIPPQAWLRLAIFGLGVAVVVWFFVGQTKTGSTEGAKNDGNKISLPEPVEKTVQVLGEQIEKIIPAEKVTELQRTFEEKVLKQGKDVVEQSNVAEEVKKIINQATLEITGFPEKQKKDLQREVVKQVCDDLLKDLE